MSATLASFLLNSTRGVRSLLSDRERQVLKLLAAGNGTPTSPRPCRSVRSYLERIRDKTGRRRRPESTRLAIEEGITT